MVSTQSRAVGTRCFSLLLVCNPRCWFGRPAYLSMSEDDNAFCSSLLLFPVCPTPLLPVLIQHVIMFVKQRGAFGVTGTNNTKAMEPNFQHLFRSLISLTFTIDEWMWSCLKCPLFGPRKSKHCREPHRGIHSVTVPCYTHSLVIYFSIPESHGRLDDFWQPAPLVYYFMIDPHESLP